MIVRVGIEAGSNRGAPNTKSSEALGRTCNAFLIPPHGHGISSKLLAEADRYCILQMGPAGLDDAVKFLRL